jgi:predicted DNA-binding protein with PD1-like motif
MRSKQINDSPRTFVLVFESGDELTSGIDQFAKEQKFSAANFKAVGTLSSVCLGWFDWGSEKYEPSVVLNEQLEVFSLIGGVALKDNEPIVHAHAMVGKKGRYIPWRPFTQVIYSTYLGSLPDGKSYGLAEVRRSTVWSRTHHAQGSSFAPPDGDLGNDSIPIQSSIPA